MISKEDFNKALGAKARELTPEEIEKLRVSMDKLADILFDIWNTGLKKKSNEKTK